MGSLSSYGAILSLFDRLKGKFKLLHCLRVIVSLPDRIKGEIQPLPLFGGDFEPF